MVRDDAVRVADHEQEQPSLLNDCSTHVVKFTMISLTVTSPHPFPLPLDWQRTGQQGVDAWSRCSDASQHQSVD